MNTESSRKFREATQRDPFVWPRPLMLSDLRALLGKGNREPSPGPDRWEKWTVTILGDQAMSFVLALLNYVLVHNYFDKLRDHYLLPMFKNRGLSSQLSNYRAVCFGNFLAVTAAGWFTRQAQAYAMKHHMIPETQVAVQSGVQQRDLTSFLANLEAWAFRAKTPIYGLVRDQKKGFDLLRPEAGYDAYHFFGFGPNAEAFDRARLAHGAFIVKTPYGLAEPFEVDGQMKQGDPPNPLRFSLAMAMVSYWLDEQAFEDPLLITTQNRARSNNHTQADELTLKITQVSAMDDTILLAKSERTLAAMTLYMEHFQEAYGAQTDWGTKTRAIIMGLGNQSDTPGTVQVATPHGRRQVTVDPAHVFLKTPFAAPDRQYTQLESIVRSIGFPSTPTRRLLLSALRRFIEQQLISRLRPRLALCPIRPDDALKLDQLIAMRIKEYYGWVFTPSAKWQE
ncbi:BZ3500_MvSof-1268-A1-R1_Chr9g10684 [Microbotryum saponariae]|uniref:BZ3500_MvSof-1268-A1-R1_Chr9g10684 protein n=1 Tax=Microbotryum saponariae TaxID=289078 RepID=A0A2X0KGT1_9BASI|nr:BZ3501_MvSof-1269-A2-R1_Chr9g10432 [Microbotryum saponariae]SDA00517.1 BZ3500_MvSof-1268-A1-R1_Chr9g10684 [Microbotryum saponariae]